MSIESVEEFRRLDKALDEDPPPPTGYGESDLAVEFVEKYKNDLRYIRERRQWLIWDGARWKPEKMGRPFDMSRWICKAASIRLHNSSDKAKAQATKLINSSTIAGVLKIAAHDKGIAAELDEWDIDPWLLNTPGGTVNLRTGEIQTHDPDDHITKSTSVTPEGDCPLFLSFLDRIMDGDMEMIAYLQRLFGYALVGVTVEEILAFLHGTGRNGKTKLLEALMGAIGEYATTAPMEAFLATKHDRHPTELAKLQGARFVTATETRKGRAWDEAKIKAITGGDTITARFMRGDFFDFQPALLLTIAGNHKPKLNTVDEAIRARIHLVPFNVTIPPEERDKNLGEKLKAEWSGILKWMVDGCLEWQDIGLQPPEAVIKATEEYLMDEDAMMRWIDERCFTDRTKMEGSTALFDDWKKWAEAAREPIGTQTNFGIELNERGFGKVKKRAGNYFIGLALASQQESAEYWEK